LLDALTSIAVALSLCLCGVAASRGRAGAQDKAADAEGIEHGRLEEIREKRVFVLLVSRSFTVDARSPSKVSASDVREALEHQGVRHARAHGVIASRLDKYVSKYKSMTAVETSPGAEVFIVFKVMRERPTFRADASLCFGKMFVFISGGGEKATPRVVWESGDEMTLAEDAADAFIKALKAVRGEK
jgi:hypothetical protein